MNGGGERHSRVMFPRYLFLLPMGGWCDLFGGYNTYRSRMDNVFHTYYFVEKIRNRLKGSSIRHERKGLNVKGVSRNKATKSVTPIHGNLYQRFYTTTGITRRNNKRSIDNMFLLNVRFGSSAFVRTQHICKVNVFSVVQVRHITIINKGRRTSNGRNLYFIVTMAREAKSPYRYVLRRNNANTLVYNTTGFFVVRGDMGASVLFPFSYNRSARHNRDTLGIVRPNKEGGFVPLSPRNSLCAKVGMRIVTWGVFQHGLHHNNGNVRGKRKVIHHPMGEGRVLLCVPNIPTIYDAIRVSNSKKGSRYHPVRVS